MTPGVPAAPPDTNANTTALGCGPDRTAGRPDERLTREVRA